MYSGVSPIGLATPSPHRAALPPTGTSPTPGRLRAEDLHHKLQQQAFQLIFYDDLFAKRGIDADLAAEAATARFEADRQTRHNAELAAKLKDLGETLGAKTEECAQAQEELLRARKALGEATDMVRHCETHHTPLLSAYEDLVPVHADTTQALARAERELEGVKAQLQAVAAAAEQATADYTAARREAESALDVERHGVREREQRHRLTAEEAQREAQRQLTAQAAAADQREADLQHARSELSTAREHAEALREELRATALEAEARASDLVAAHSAAGRDGACLALTTDALERLAMAVRQAARNGPVDTTPLAVPAVDPVFADAVRELGEDLDATIRHAAASVRAEVARGTDGSRDVIQRSFADCAVGLEAAHGAVATRLLRAQTRIGDIAAAAGGTVRRVASQSQRLRAVSAQLAAVREHAARDADMAQQEGRRARELQQRVEALTQDKAGRDMQEAVVVATGEVRRGVDGAVQDVAQSFRQQVINTNVITTEVVANAEHLARRTWHVVQEIHDAIDAVAPSARDKPRAVTPTRRSGSPAAVAPASSASAAVVGRQGTVEYLCNQACNIAVLLANNQRQGEEVSRRFTLLLEQFKVDLVTELRGFEHRVTVAVAQRARETVAAATGREVDSTGVLPPRAPSFEAAHPGLPLSPSHTDPMPPNYRTLLPQ